MTVVVMPAITPETTTATLVRWLVAPGDTVAVDDILAELETDKTIIELASDVAGMVRRLLVVEGTEEVPVGVGLLEITALEAEVSDDSDAAPVKSTAPSPMPVVASVGIDTKPVVTTLGEALAAQLGGTEPVDVEALLDAHCELATSESGTRDPARIDAGPVTPPIAFDREPADGIRRAIAKKMSASKPGAPHFYLTVECNMGALLDIRREVNSTEPSPGVTINDLLIRCLALAFEDEPALNVAWDNGDLLRFRQVNVAVAMATGQGLLTPVIHNANKRGVRDISATMRQLAERAATGQITPAELLGGTTTLTNLGHFGVREAIAVLNPPQASILAIGAVEQRPMVWDGAVVVGTGMSCTLSVDHRAADGVAAARTLAAFKAIVEHPLRLIL